MKTPAIEVFGGDFNNRGGQLMLWATIQRLRASCPEAICAIDAEWKSPFKERSSYGLYTLCPSLPRENPRRAKVFRSIGNIASKIIPKSSFTKYGLLGCTQADALVDIAGYAYGDKWPAFMYDISQRRYQYYSRQNKPVILLPQMLGPFGNAEHKAGFQRMTQNVSKIYARDDISYQETQNCLGSQKSDKIGRSPDITIEVQPGPIPHKYKDLLESNYAIITPNARMLDKASEAWKANYIQLLDHAIEVLQKN
ncbi:MAG: polysaccharide pyruvyl transferase family protein, partial [Pseudomonadota bacterium]